MGPRWGQDWYMMGTICGQDGDKTETRRGQDMGSDEP